MSTIHYVIITAGLLLLCAQATSASPMVAITTDTEWLFAGGSESSWITVQVADGAGDPLKGADVVFSCDPAMGTLKPGTKKTGADGTASVRFTAGTKSGTAVIAANVTWKDGENIVSVSAVCEQQIDHATPQNLLYLCYPREVTVGATAPLVLALTDRYGNPVDSRCTAETARFITGSPGYTAGIWDGTAYADDICLPVNESGNLTALFRADCVTGENIVYVDLPSPMTDVYLTICGVGDGVPASISASVSPAVPVPADGTGTYAIVYTVKDCYGNPAGNRSVNIAALPGEETTIRTNSLGTGMISYGPKDSAGTVAVTATAVDNASVTITVPLQFTPLAASNMLLTASPQTMPSRDKKPGITSTVRAKIMDEKGNPVAGECVSFGIVPGDPQGASLDAMAAITDRDGYASVLFTPGAFPVPGEAGYVQTATASCVVGATWGEVTRSITLTWKNYPFLSVTTSLEPQTVAVNDTVNVTVTLMGDGWALQPRPIDVVLAIDCSKSMSEAIAGADTKIAATRTAAKTFVVQMDQSRDRIGLVPYSDRSAPVQVPVSVDYAAVIAAIETLSPGGYTPTRLALKCAVEELVSTPNADTNAVKAVVLMSDGAYNYFGDPLARGCAGSSYYVTDDDPTVDYRWYGYCDGSSSRYGYDFTTLPEDDLSAYALAHGIRIYCISFGDGIVEGDNTYDTMTTLAESTGGFHEHAPDADTLSEIYTRIAGNLKEEAGVETVMDISMQEITVNDECIPGVDVLDYEYIDGFSTAVESWIGTGASRSSVVTPFTLDQRDDWVDDRVLNFDVGTVRLDQIWAARYTLKVKKEGNINVFGPESVITFNEGANTLSLPDTFVTAVADLKNNGFEGPILDVADLHREDAGPVAEFLKVGWSLNYTGNDQATQQLYYSSDDGHTWVWCMTMPPVSAGNRTQQACIDVQSFPAGYYTLRVHARAPDTPDDSAELPLPILFGTGNAPKIKLE